MTLKWLLADLCCNWLSRTWPKFENVNQNRSGLETTFSNVLGFWVVALRCKTDGTAAKPAELAKPPPKKLICWKREKKKTPLFQCLDDSTYFVIPRIKSLIGRRPWLFSGASDPGGGVLPYETIQVCAAPSGRVFAPFWFENGYTLCPF